MSQLNPNLSQLNPNLSQLNLNLSQLNPDFHPKVAVLLRLSNAGQALMTVIVTNNLQSLFILSVAVVG